MGHIKDQHARRDPAGQLGHNIYHRRTIAASGLGNNSLGAVLQAQNHRPGLRLRRVV